MLAPPTKVLSFGEVPAWRRYHVFGILLIFILLRGALAGTYPQLERANDSPLAQTKNGTYQGVHLPTFDQDFFGGIPFAQSTQRLLPAVSLNTSFSDVRTAAEFGVGCIGFGGDNVGLEVGEDCLTLNVIRPSGTRVDDRLPVLVWIYGA